MTNLLIGYPDIPVRALVVKDEAGNLPGVVTTPGYGLLDTFNCAPWVGRRYVPSPPTVHYLQFDLGAGVSASANYVALIGMAPDLASGGPIAKVELKAGSTSTEGDATSIYSYNSPATAAAGLGRSASDFWASFSASLAYRFWWLEFTVSGDYYDFGQCSFGRYLDLGRDPSAYTRTPIFSGKSREQMPTGNTVQVRARDPKYRFSFTWERVTDADTEAFLTHVASRPAEDYFFLRTQTNHDPLNGYRLVYCQLTTGSVKVAKKPHQASATNTISASFDEV